MAGIQCKGIVQKLSRKIECLMHRASIRWSARNVGLQSVVKVCCCACDVITYLLFVIKGFVLICSVAPKVCLHAVLRPVLSLAEIFMLAIEFYIYIHAVQWQILGNSAGLHRYALS